MNTDSRPTGCRGEDSNLCSGGEHDPTVGGLLHRAETEPIGIDISDYSDEWCEGFLAGQRSVLEEIFAGRLVLPGRGVPS